MSTQGIAVSAALVELSVAATRSETATDSEGYFRIETNRSAHNVSGRLRIVAAGYRSYERVVEVRADRPDHGVFTLQSDPPREGASEDPAAQLQRRLQLILESPRDVLDKYSSALSAGNGGVATLLSDQAIDENRAILKIRGEGRYYSFLRRTHEYGHGSDIKFENGGFKTGFAGLDYGYFLNVGDVAFERLANASREAPSWLPSSKRAAWEYMWKYTPPNVTVEARRAQRAARNLVVGGVSVAERAAAIPSNSYLLRSINFNESDLLVAVRAERLTNDGSMVIAWKILGVNDTPVARGPEPEP